MQVGPHVLMIIYASYGVGALFFPPISGALLYHAGALSYPLLLLALIAFGLLLCILYSIVLCVINRTQTVV